jgi:soluble lytic murein transglycosylase-like protein
MMVARNRAAAAIGAVLAFVATPALAAAATTAADAEADAVAGSAARAQHIPAALDASQREAYRQVFAAIRAQRWTDAQIGLDTMQPGPLHPIARAELYAAKGSPRIEVDALVQLLNQAPELPEAETLARLARSRGATDLPPLPMAQALVWRDGAPRRTHTRTVKSDLIAADLATRMVPLVKGDRAADAQALLDATVGLTPEADTEWRQKVAWMYFLTGDDANARTLAERAANGSGDWAIQGRWVGALAAWRAGDYPAAEAAFEGVAARAADVDLRAAALYWASRADIAAGRPDKVAARLTGAAQFGESFYGQLARQALALRNPAAAMAGAVSRDWALLASRPNVRVAAALAEVGEDALADQVIRQQARIGSAAEFPSLVRIAEALDLPATTVWLAHNCPSGVTTASEASFPMPSWAPERGWRVEKALVYAHTLEESGFRSRVTSRAGAYGLMQIMPAAATDFAREGGTTIDRDALTKPSTNMEIGQRHLERLRDMAGVTGGLLPKVIAAYNAGPKPVGEWNATIRDGGDPLLYIESIPYWETRGYVTTVLRNYWVYQAKGGKASLPSRAALAQGLWPRFPGLSGAASVRLVGQPLPRAVAPAIAISASVPPRPSPVTLPSGAASAD